MHIDINIHINIDIDINSLVLPNPVLAYRWWHHSANHGSLLYVA